MTNATGKDYVASLTATYSDARRKRLVAEKNLKLAEAALAKAEHEFKEAKAAEKNSAEVLSDAVRDGD